MLKSLLTIDKESKIPKYQQIVETVILDIETGLIKIGGKIPSINEMSEEFDLSRDTVEKAYRILMHRGIITSVRGKGYYVATTAKNRGRRILLLFNKLSDHKKSIYNSFIKNIDVNDSVDLMIHHSDSSVLEKLIIENLGKYDYYAIMPHLKEETMSVIDALNMIPKDKLLLVNKDMDKLDGEYACVFEDFELDIHHALHTGIEVLRKYKRLNLVFPTINYYCSGIKMGFVNFCEAEGFDWEIMDSPHEEIEKGDVYIVIEEADLVEVIKQCNAGCLQIGKDVGIISYNDTPFKEILAGGISTLSTDFDKMGELMAQIIKEHTLKKVKNDFYLKIRKSL